MIHANNVGWKKSLLERMRMPRFNPARAIRWIGDVDDKNLKRAMKKLNELLKDEKKAEIFLMIQSEGGDMSTGFAFYDYVNSVLKQPLTTIALGEVASMGITLFLAGKRRIVTPSSHFFLHPGEFKPKGRLEDVGGMTNAVKRMDKRYDEIIHVASKGKISLKKANKLSRKVTVVTPEEAIELGLAHEMWTP